jgi:hypothetical protein
LLQDAQSGHPDGADFLYNHLPDLGSSSTPLCKIVPVL